MAELCENQFVLMTRSSATLRGDIRWEKQSEESQTKKLPVIIVCHGFKAFKDWGPFPAIGRYFALQGFVSIVMNFSHNGIGEEPRKFVEHEKFANNTISLEIEDVKTVLNEITGNGFGLPFIDKDHIGLVGHSRGGAVCVIAAKEDKRVKAVAAWSTIAHFDRTTDEQKKRWREKGFVQLHTVSEQNLFRINVSLLDDIENNAERLDIVNAVRELRKPLLIVHGTADIPAKIEEAENLFTAFLSPQIAEIQKITLLGRNNQESRQNMQAQAECSAVFCWQRVKFLHDCLATNAALPRFPRMKGDWVSIRETALKVAQERC